MSDSFSLRNVVSPLRSKGEKSRAAILLAAAQLATTRGLQGLSIGDLAAHLGMSKSGLYAHFKSKEELELATIETAAQIFDREVLQSVRAAPPGARRLIALVEAFLSHLERRVFPGGCFFAAVAAELDTRPGRAHDRVLEVLNQWRSLIRQCIEESRTHHEIDRDIEMEQTVFEVQAMLTAANFLFVLTKAPMPLQQARKGVQNMLDRLSTGRTAKKKPRTRHEA
jgi:AcrR family transcriptional regulator